MKPKTIHIIYGFCEGPLHGRKFCQNLQEAGYTMSKSPEDAAIIIAHSGGCYLIPSDGKERTIFHVGYTYWPRKSLLASVKELIRYETVNDPTQIWLRRRLFNMLYAWNLAQTFRMIPG